VTRADLGPIELAIADAIAEQAPDVAHRLIDAIERGGFAFDIDPETRVIVVRAGGEQGEAFLRLSPEYHVLADAPEQVQ
jgi:hypothetical protein